MSNLSSGSASSLSASTKSHTRCVPNSCWCGKPIVELVSKTNKNLDRLFYRCDHAAKLKLKDDSHFFKWVDEVEMSNELKLKMLEDEVSEMKDALKECIDVQNKLSSKVEKDVEERLIMKLDDAVAEMRAGLNKRICFGFILGCVLSLGCIKLFV